MAGLKVELVAKNNPELTLIEDSNVPMNVVLKFFVGAFFYMMIAMA